MENVKTPEEIRQMKEEIRKYELSKTQDRKAYKELVKDTVPVLVDRLKSVSSQLSIIKADVFENFKEIMKLKAEVYNEKEDQATHTFTSPCGKSITIGYRTTDGWDDTFSAGVSKVNSVLRSLAKDENSAYLVKMIQRLLKQDEKGNLKLSRILELKANAEESNNLELIDGVEIILAAHIPVRSNWFIEASYKTEAGVKTNIPLAISSVEFPADFQFDFFNVEVSNK